MSKSILALCIIAILVASAMGESVVASLKARVESGESAAPCNKAAPAAAGPAPPRQFLDVRLPVVVDDYHAPVGGFNPSHIPDKEVDVAARVILREIQTADAEAKANGDEPQKPDDNGVISTEEHKALKQLLLDSDILVRAAAKALSENGPIDAAQVKKVAVSAVLKAAKLEKKAAKPEDKKKTDKKAKKDKKSKKGDKKAKKSAPIKKLAAAAAAAKPAAPAAAAPAPAAVAAPAAAAPAPAAVAAPAAAVGAAAPAPAAIPVVGAAAPVSKQAKTAAATKSAKAQTRF